MGWRDWAENQVRKAGLCDLDSDYDGAIGKNLNALIGVFSSARHSGASAQLTSEIFQRLVENKPLVRTWVVDHGPDQIYEKFRVWRVGAKVWLDEDSPGEFVFTLRPEKDERAYQALRTYAASCMTMGYPILGKELSEILDRIEQINNG